MVGGAMIGLIHQIEDIIDKGIFMDKMTLDSEMNQQVMSNLFSLS